MKKIYICIPFLLETNNCYKFSRYTGFSTRREFFLRVYPENMIVGQHCISRNFNVNFSHSLIKLQ